MKIICSADLTDRMLLTLQRAPFTEQLTLGSVVGPFESDYALGYDNVETCETQVSDFCLYYTDFKDTI